MYNTWKKGGKFDQTLIYSLSNFSSFDFELIIITTEYKYVICMYIVHIRFT